MHTKSPKNPLFLVLLVLATLGMMAAQWCIFVFAPVEISMGIVQKIFYLHVPLAWWALVFFALVCLFGILFLRTSRTKWDIYLQAANEIGLLCAVLALFSGSIWGRYAWGLWWTWDPRLTSSLVLCFLYAATLLVRQMNMGESQRARLSASLGIISFINVPLVYFSARLWRSAHPVVFGKGGGLDADMLTSLLVSLFAFGTFCLVLFCLRIGQLHLQRQVQSAIVYGTKIRERA